MVSQKSPPPLTFEEIRINGLTLGHEYMTLFGAGGVGVAKKSLISTLIKLNLYLKVLKTIFIAKFINLYIKNIQNGGRFNLNLTSYLSLTGRHLR